MVTINSRTDIETYVSDSFPDFLEHGLHGALAEAIHDAYLADNEAPEYGRDWSEWLSGNAPALAETVSAANIVTDRDIAELSEEAGAAGDSKTLGDCELALGGDQAARGRCERIILEWRRERESTEVQS